MSAAAGKTTKPLMRGLLRNQIRRNLISAFFVCASAVATWKIMVNDVHKKQYDDYYRNLDINKEFHRMRKRGVFDSCSPDDDE